MICSAFCDLRARADGGDTVLTGVLADQAARYGVLAGAGALGLELIEVRRLPPRDQPQQPSPEGGAREMIAAVGPGEVDVAAGRVAGVGGGGVVARPGLFGRLGGQARVVVMAAPAGSGKTVLLRSWIGQAGLAGRAAWVAVERDERDPLGFWLSVVGALRRTSEGSDRKST